MQYSAESVQYSDMARRTRHSLAPKTSHGCAPQVAVLVAEGIKLAISTAAYAVECGGMSGASRLMLTRHHACHTPDIADTPILP